MVSKLGQDATYEEVCRAHFEAYVNAAAAAATQTALGARVSDWRQKIGPILEQQVMQSVASSRVSVHACVMCW